MTLSFSPTSVRQIKNIFAYIARDNLSAASEVIDRIIEVAEFVAAHPNAGHATVVRGVRAIPANPYPYVIYFRRSANGVRLLRVMHAAQKRPELREDAREFLV